MFATVSLLWSYELNPRVLMVVVVVIYKVTHPLTCIIDGCKSSVGALTKVPGRLGNSKAPGNFAYSCTFVEHLVPFGDLFQLLF